MHTTTTTTTTAHRCKSH